MDEQNTKTIHYFTTLVKWRKLIFVNFLVFTVLTAVYALVIPKQFTATAVILPPSEESSLFGITNLVRNLPITTGLGMGPMAAESNLFLAILNSRSVMESIAKKFDLMEIYETENMEMTIKALRDNFSAAINDDGTISVSATAATDFFAYGEAEENRARFLARDMANAFIEELDKLNSKLKTEKARNNRIFIEKRYEQNLTDLRKAEEDLKAFQNEYGLVALPEQTEVTISALAELNAQIIVKEVEVGVLSQYLSGSHGELSRAKRELNQLRNKFNEMKSGAQPNLGNGTSGTKDAQLFVPLNDAPDLGLKYLRLYREVTLQQKILEFLLPEYEQAKIQEAKDTPTVQVLDKAVAPVLRASPKRTLMVLVSGFLSFIISICLILLFERWNLLREEGGEEYREMKTALLNLRSDLPFKRRE